MKKILWHSKQIEEIFKSLDSSKKGLSTQDAKERVKKYGKNTLPRTKPKSALERFLSQFHNILIYVLIVAGFITTFLGEFVDAGVIFGVVFINAIIGYIQEGKAQNALEAIKNMLSTNAKVLRDGTFTQLDAKYLTKGDIIYIESGDKIPADIRVFTCKDFYTQESILTGESLPIEKSIDPVEETSPLADRTCMAYSGTFVTSGEAKGIVVETGENTELGSINKMVTKVKSVTTPLLRQMDIFGKWLTFAILFIAGLTFFFGVFIQDYTAIEMYFATVSLAVAAIPEGLPAIMTITLAIGVGRMAKRNAIIRKLPAVETLGSVSIICTDKTGTLTQNEMKVESIIVEPLHVKLLAKAASLCNNASFRKKDSWKFQGDPMEEALLEMAVENGIELYELNSSLPRIDTIPFDSKHRFMATLNQDSEKKCIYIKGAPEVLLAKCKYQEGNKEFDKSYWEDKIHSLAAKGQRVLAFAYKPYGDSKLDFKTIQDLTLIGIVGIIDPPREEAKLAVQTCKKAGIIVKMITGDHAITASAIAKEVGIKNTKVLTGEMLDKLSEDEFSNAIAEVDVYARVSPEHKLKLVQHLQNQNNIVAMTGDGVNDAPALKRADIGTAMGKNGSEVAKEASDMVLTDDNFVSITSAIEEGRTVYDNLKKAILFILPTNSGEALSVIVAILFGFEYFPLTPVHILWVNMITAVTLALVLAFEPTEKGIMERIPHRANEPILNTLLIWRIAFVGVVMMLGTFGLFIYELELGKSLEYARTVAVNTLVAFEIFYLFNSRYITAPILNKKGLFGNPYALGSISILILFQLAFTYLSPMQELFKTVSIDGFEWVKITLIASSVLFLVEFEKALVRKSIFKYFTQIGKKII